MTSLTEESAVPLCAIQELVGSIDSSNLQILDPTIGNDVKSKAVTEILSKTGFPFHLMAEQQFLGGPLQFIAPGTCIIGVPSPGSKYRVIEQCIASGIPSFLLVQTTVIHSKQLSELVRRYSTPTMQVSVSIVIPHRRIHFHPTMKCPFDTLWIGLHVMNRVERSITFCKPWFTERQKRKIEDQGTGEATKKRVLVALQQALHTPDAVEPNTTEAPSISPSGAVVMQ